MSVRLYMDVHVRRAHCSYVSKPYHIANVYAILDS